LAADISVTVLTIDNKPLADAVVYVDTNQSLATKSLPMAIMDQQNKAFVPHVLAVPVGTTVDFPNTDSVNHYVYSFSDIKKFQFKLFKGDLEKHQMLFDRPGVVAIGCNIHDFMLGYIFVSPSNYVSVTNTAGQVRLNLPDKGDFKLAIWHERSNENLEALTHTITGNAAPQTALIRFSKGLKPQRKMTHEGEDY
jgi:plastocyanin